MSGGADTGATGYSWWQVALHWSIAGLIGVQYLLHPDVEILFDGRIEGTAGGGNLFGWAHILSGGTIFILAVVRLALRFRIGVPAAHSGNPWLVNALAFATHLALYGLLFVLPLTGFAAWVLRSEVVAELHELGWTLLLWLIGFHVAGAVVEQVIMGNDSLNRMMLGEGEPENAERPEQSVPGPSKLADGDQS